MIEFEIITDYYESVATELMAEMVNDGWNIHTFSKDKNNHYYALMEREVPDDSTS